MKQERVSKLFIYEHAARLRNQTTASLQKSQENLSYFSSFEIQIKKILIIFSPGRNSECLCMCTVGELLWNLVKHFVAHFHKFLHKNEHPTVVNSKQDG
jgi:hypothetical protein